MRASVRQCENNMVILAYSLEAICRFWNRISAATDNRYFLACYKMVTFHYVSFSDVCFTFTFTFSCNPFPALAYTSFIFAIALDLIFTSVNRTLCISRDRKFFLGFFPLLLLLRTSQFNLHVQRKRKRVADGCLRVPYIYFHLN